MKIIATILNIFFIPIYFILALISAVCTFLPLFSSVVALQNLKQRLKCTPIKARLYLFLIYMNYGFYLIEMLVFLPLGVVYFTNPDAQKYAETILRKINKNSSVVFLGAHFGSIEAVGLFIQSMSLKLRGTPLVALAKPAKVPLFTWFMNLYRKRLGFEVIWTGTETFFQTFIKVMQSARFMGLVVDQKPSSKGAFIQFFGEFSAFPTGGLDLACKNNAAIMFTTARRILPGIFYIHCENGSFDGESQSTQQMNVAHVSTMRESNPQVTQILSAYARWLEDIVTRHPSQWFWDYKKWSRKPESYAKLPT